MKFLDRFRRSGPVATAPAPAAEPAAHAGPVTFLAPLQGRIVPLEQVPDPVFSSRMLGDGFAIDPGTNVLCAPFAGTVASLPKARHAITLRADNGAEVLMHIGIDTVSLAGEGFVAHVREGNRVAAGDRLISFDAASIGPRVPSLLIPIILTNGDGYALADRAPEGPVERGSPCCTLSAAAAPAPLPPLEAADDGALPEFRTTSQVQDPFGIHARPAGVIAARAKTATSQVRLVLGGREADARSSVAIMLLGAQAGDVISIEAHGPDARTDAEAIAALVAAPGASGAVRRPAPTAVAPVAGQPQTPAAVTLDPAGVQRTLPGVTAAPGLAVGIAHRLVREDLVIIEQGQGEAEERAALAEAVGRVRDAIEDSIAPLDNHGSHGGQPQEAEILSAHLSFLEDPHLHAVADELIASGKSATFAWHHAVQQQVTALRQLGNEVLAERAVDLEDVERRVLKAIAGCGETRIVLPEGAILFAEDLLPSQFTELDLDRVSGICLAASGPTSHVAILSASHGIAAIVAAGPDTLRVPDGEPVLLDADRARAVVNPPPADLDAARTLIAARRARIETNRKVAAADCRMADGTRIEVVANLGSVSEVAGALANGAEGCGLLRSEFLYLHRTAAPGEDEQFAEYQAIATALDGRALIIRTLDAGADKDVPYALLPTEENPALGLRGVRLSLWQPDLLRTQVRAILRVKPYGQCKILLPMIATIADVRTVKAVIAAEAEALGRDAPIEVGIMVEVPSVALVAARFAEEVDFFSIGTNDLTQYALAMDRCNPRLAPQLDPLHPAVLRLIALACEGAATRARWVGVCGNIASAPLAAPLLIGLGVTELSATPNVIADIKALVRTLDINQCRAVAAEALALDSGEAVRHLLESRWPDQAPAL